MGIVTGDMLVNGKPLPISFQRQTGLCFQYSRLSGLGLLIHNLQLGYVQQQDVHMATTTVREALAFSALLRQPASTPKSEKLAYVEEVIKLLEMEMCVDFLECGELN